MNFPMQTHIHSLVFTTQLMVYLLSYSVASRKTPVFTRYPQRSSSSPTACVNSGWLIFYPPNWVVTVNEEADMKTWLFLEYKQDTKDLQKPNVAIILFFGIEKYKIIR